MKGRGIWVKNLLKCPNWKPVRMPSNIATSSLCSTICTSKTFIAIEGSHTKHAFLTG